MTCNDCIHSQVCGYRDQLDINHEYYAEQCEHYKEERSLNMREILFRGKRADSGEWVTGSLLTLDSPRIINNTDSGLAGYVVLSSTVGQYTGICDKEGTRIFEGDILITHGEILEVRYHDWTGHINAVDKNGVTYPFLKDMRVIGNIHDSAELLEGFE